MGLSEVNVDLVDHFISTLKCEKRQAFVSEIHPCLTTDGLMVCSDFTHLMTSQACH